MSAEDEDSNNITQPIFWNAEYWNAESHGTSWDQVKLAFQRDWEQTKADVGWGGKELEQSALDTLKQGVGSQSIPGPNTANPKPPWEDVEPGVRYGYAARHQYGLAFDTWNEELERKLQSEWDEKRSGRTFESVRNYVRRGWNWKS